MLDIVGAAVLGGLIGGSIGAGIMWYKTWSYGVRLNSVEAQQEEHQGKIKSLMYSVKGQKGILKQKERQEAAKEEDQAVKQLIQQGLSIYLSGGTPEEKKAAAFNLIKKNPKAIGKIADKYGLSDTLGEFL